MPKGPSLNVSAPCDYFLLHEPLINIRYLASVTAYSSRFAKSWMLEQCSVAVREYRWVTVILNCHIRLSSRWEPQFAPCWDKGWVPGSARNDVVVRACDV